MAKTVKRTVKQATTRKKPANTQRKKQHTPQAPTAELPFGRMNYILLGIGVLVIALGFFLMAQDEFVDATKFSVSLYVAPVIVIGGFVEIIFAIMYKDKSKVSDTTVATELAE